MSLCNVRWCPVYMNSSSWYAFGLAMIHLFQRSVGVALRIGVAGACCLGIWSSLRFARADYLFQQNTEESVRAAIRLVPDGWEYYLRLSQFDRLHARELLDTALRLNRYNAQAYIELGMQYEADGDFTKAEKLLLSAYEVDHTYLPRWSLANYYFRRDNMPAFWAWAHSAAEMPSDEVGPLFELCWRVSPDPEKISAAILNQKPEFIRQYVGFLLAKNQLLAVSIIAPRLVSSGDAESDRPLLFLVVNRLIAMDDATAASALWHLLIEQHWVVADTAVPNNAAFARESLPVGFDWSIPEYHGLHSWPGPSGLVTEFTGSQPEKCTVAEQALALAPGNYAMAFSYRTTEIPPATGLRWQVIHTKSDTVLAQSPDLSSNTLQHSTVAFTVPPGDSILRLRLVYQRALGTPRISGTLVVLSTEIQALHRL
jgi:tetratricopeptide (TPR) repeat protein